MTETINIDIPLTEADLKQVGDKMTFNIGLNLAISGQVTVSGGGVPAALESAEVWLSASDKSTLTLSGTDVTGWSNKGTSGGEFQLVGRDSTYTSPTYDASNAVANGKPAVVFDGVNNGLEVTANPSTWTSNFLMAVCAYNDGVDTTFNANACLVSRFAGGGAHRQVAGSSGKAVLNSFTSNYNPPAGVSVNGAVSSLTVLPLPMSVLESDAQTTDTILRSVGNRLDRGGPWLGPICEIATWETKPSTTEINAVREYWAGLYGITL